MAQQIEIKDGLPFAGTNEPTLDITFPTSPGWSTGATISVETARELVRAIQEKLNEIDHRS